MEKSSRREEYVVVMSPDQTQARYIAVALAERAEELARLLGNLPEQPGASAVDRVRNAEREVGEQLERLAAQMEELLPAEPMERLYERDGTHPASAEQLAAFVAEHSIPSEAG